MMKKSSYCILLIGLLVIQAVVAQPQVATLPLQFNTGNAVAGAATNLPSTTITIQGQSIPLVVDSGEAQVPLALSEAVLQRIHTIKTNEESCATSIVTGKTCLPIVIIPEIEIGGFTLKHVRAEVMTHLWGDTQTSDFKQSAASRNGVIGLPLLSQFNVLFDYSSASMTLFKRQSGKKPAGIKHWVAIAFHDHLLTHLIVDGQPMVMGWDTGAVPGVMKQTSVKTFKKYARPPGQPYGHAENCSRVIPMTLTTQTGQSLKPTWFIVRPFPPAAPFDGLMGANFFSHNRIYIDFEHHQLYVKPVEVNN